MDTEAQNPQMPTEGGVYARNNVATAELCEVPEEWKGRFVTFQAISQDVYILFGDSGVVAAVATRSGKSTNALTRADGASWVIPAGQSLSRRVPKTYRNAAGVYADTSHFSFISAAASGHWTAFSDGPGST